MSVCGVRIRSIDPDSWRRWLPEFNVDFLVNRYIYDKIFIKIPSTLPEVWAKLWKNALSRNVEGYLVKVMNPDPQADDFQNSTVLPSPQILECILINNLQKYVMRHSFTFNCLRIRTCNDTCLWSSAPGNLVVSCTRLHVTDSLVHRRAMCVECTSIWHYQIAYETQDTPFQSHLVNFL